MTTPGTRGGFLTTSQAAERLHVHPKTVGRWARQGRLACLRTLGGHRRFDPDTVEQLAADLGQPTSDDSDDSDGPEAALGRAVVAQLAVQGWAITHQPGSPPDDPCDPAA
jgi:excisionase family DNA binding protein